MKIVTTVLKEGQKYLRPASDLEKKKKICFTKLKTTPVKCTDFFSFLSKQRQLETSCLDSSKRQLVKVSSEYFCFCIAFFHFTDFENMPSVAVKSHIQKDVEKIVIFTIAKRLRCRIRQCEREL